jgi:preprotein translocase subunit SecY
MHKEIMAKILFSLAAIALFRLGSHIPVPYIDASVLLGVMSQYTGGTLDVFNALSGGSIKRFAILSIGIMPYISASIVIQLLSLAMPHLKQLKEQGSQGAIKINAITKKLAIAITLFQAYSICTLALQQSYLGQPLVSVDPVLFFCMGITTLLTGTMIMIWMSEKLTEFGIGSGISTIIFASIVSGIPSYFMEINQNSSAGLSLQTIILGCITLTLFFIVTRVETARRKIQLISQNNYSEKNALPLKVNLAGIMPAIFASMLLYLPATISSGLSPIVGTDVLMDLQSKLPNSWIITMSLYACFIIAISLMYTKTTFNPKKITENLRAQGKFIKGIRPGKPTEQAITIISQRLTIISAIYMALVCVIPEILNLQFNATFYLGGTAMLIMITVSKEWVDFYQAGNVKKQYENITSKTDQLYFPT